MQSQTNQILTDSQATFGDAAVGAFSLWPLLLFQATFRLLLLFIVSVLCNHAKDYNTALRCRQPPKQVGQGCVIFHNAQFETVEIAGNP